MSRRCQVPKPSKQKLSTFLREVKKVVREVDGSVQTLTGSSLKQYLNGAIKEFTEDTLQKQPERPDNYAVLGVTPVTPPEKVKQVYLALVKVYHEAGLSPNDLRMKDINSAYEAICKERGWPK